MNDTIAELTALHEKVGDSLWDVDEGDFSVYARDDSGDTTIIFPSCEDCINPDDNEDNARLTVAMRNALPELLRYAKIGSEPCDDCESLQNDLDDAKDWIGDMIKVVRRYFPQTEVGDDGDYYVADIADAIRMKLTDDERERNAALARTEKAEAERDVMARRLSREGFPCSTYCPAWNTTFCKPHKPGSCVQSVNAWAAQEAAKRESEV